MPYFGEQGLYCALFVGVEIVLCNALGSRNCTVPYVVEGGLYCALFRFSEVRGRKLCLFGLSILHTD
jgi:hypothetical protein